VNAEPAPVGASAPEPSMGRMFARGSFWALSGFGGGQVLRFASNLILWRMLMPEAFGTMALVSSFLLGLQMFSDVGIGQSIIQNERGDDPRFLDTAWTVQVVRGATLSSVAILLGWPIAEFYAMPDLRWLVPVAGLTAALSGFASTKIFTTTRAVSLRGRTLIDLTSQVVGFVAMLIWALVHPSVWALVSGGIVTTATRAVLSHVALPGRYDRFAWDRGSLDSLVHFGRWIFFSTLATFIAMQSDRLIFGKLVPVATLGIYSIAQIWATAPGGVLGNVIMSVVFPVLARLRNRGQPIGPAMRKLRVPVLLAAGFMASCLIGGGPALIGTLYDARATNAGWMVQLLAVGIIFGVFENLNTQATLALGYANWSAFSNSAKVAGMFVLIPLGWTFYGFPGAIAGFAGSDALKYVVSSLGTARHRVAAFGQDVWIFAAVIGSSAFGLAVARAARHAALPPFAEGAAVGALEALFWGALLIAWRRRTRVSQRLVRAPATAEVES
jgi:O-antigen/teichoic acid export membrane protein